MKKALLGGVALSSLLIAGCDADRLNVPNPNSATVAAAAADAQALQLQATGVLRQLRNGRGAFITSTARFGREAYVYTPQEGRNTSHYLIGISGANKLDPSGFAAANWGTQYGNLRDLFNIKNSAAASTALTNEQKNAALGFARTLEGLELLYVLSTRDTLGLVVELKQNASDLAPFVSRDSGFKYILAALDEGYAKLTSGGASFPFALHAGFSGFNTPATFAQFNRAITARAAAYYATSGGGAAAWTKVTSALGQSFLNATAGSKASLATGVYHVYSAATGDAGNGLDQATNTDLYSHMSIQTDVQKKADGLALDDRYVDKIRVAPLRAAPQGLGVTSSLGFQIWKSLADPVAIIRNEELVLLRAEARLGAGDKTGAVADIDYIRAVSGGLPASGLTGASSNDAILTELLYNKRYSLLMEGHRWVDTRRYGRLSTLPLDITSGTNAHFVAKVQPVPQAECLSRAGKAGALAGPGC